MAEDDKGAKEGQVPADPPAIEPSAETFKQASNASRPKSDPASEWTVSDTRGPLGRAGSEEEHASGAEPTPTTVPSLGPAREPSDVLHEAVGATAAETPHEVKHESAATADPKPDPVLEPAGSDEKIEAATAPAHIVHEVKRPLLPIAAGIVIGAAIGAAGAALVYRSVQNDVMPDEVARLASRVDALEKKPGSEASVAALKQNIADLDSKVAGLGKSGETASGDLAPLQSKIAALQSSLAELKAQTGDAKGVDEKLGRLEAAVAGMKNQASSAEAGVAEVQGQQKQLAGKVMVPALAVVADSLVQQIDQGQPYASQVDALAALGADPAKIAVLRQNAATGVPSAKVLATKFEPLAEPLTNVAHHAPANAGFVERLKSGMMSMVSVHRADDLSGNDPISRVARIKSDLAHDDVAAALASWDGLPTEAKTKGEAWRALAKTHADAMVAARALQREAIAALGGRKS